MEIGRWKEINKKDEVHYFHQIIGNYEAVVFIDESTKYKTCRYMGVLYSNHTGKKLLMDPNPRIQHSSLTTALTQMEVRLREIIIRELLQYSKFFGIKI